ncbi:unnamed protein product [Periconia digitata]|uniref:Uncharacterized protein n=1 Tax=Periconia digitata TaxID=1303443 RepID=A0A9W4UGK7_9PLEO|nr:unnamed protein product [Periconia digitata]
MSSSQTTNSHMLAADSTNDTTIAASRPPSILPTELWLQILETNPTKTHLADLWRNVRPVSQSYKAYVERIFTTVYLPTLSLSLALPRRDPITGALRYSDAVPDAELILRGVQIDGEFLTLATLPTTRSGISLENLNKRGGLSKERLDGATSVWLWFGGIQNRGKGGRVKMPLDVEWDEQRKVWQTKVSWKRLMGSYFH